MARILLVEDNAVTAEMFRVRFVHAGHEVHVAGNGAEALAQLRAARSDLLLLETLVAEQGGLQLLRQIKQDALLASVPVVVVSARAHEEDILAALAAGAEDFLPKPVLLRELVARVERILSQGPSPLRVAVQADAGATVVGEVVDANPRSTSVRFHRDGAPCFALGEPAKLSLRSPALAHAIVLSARVGSRREGEPHRSYGFELQTRTPDEREMASAYLDLVGRRNALRAPLGRSEEVPVAVRFVLDGESHALIGRLLDVSTGGVRLLLKSDAERLLCRIDAIEVRFRLPGNDAELVFAASIRHRIAAADDGAIYGVRFDAAHAPNYVEQVAQLNEFVVARLAGARDQRSGE
jgi:DNA-binding response OmpR family regulator